MTQMIPMQKNPNLNPKGNSGWFRAPKKTEPATVNTIHTTQAFYQTRKMKSVSWADNY